MMRVHTRIDDRDDHSGTGGQTAAVREMNRIDCRLRHVLVPHFGAGKADEGRSGKRIENRDRRLIETKT